MDKLIILYNKLCTIDEKIRFLFIGCVNAGIAYLIFALCIFILGQQHYQLCVILEWVLSSPISYLNQKFFVFCTKGNYIKEYLKCWCTWAVSMVLNSIILEILMRYAWKNAYFEQIVSTFIVAIVTYVLFKYFAFKKPEEKKCI